MKKLLLITKMLVVLLVLNFSCSSDSISVNEEDTNESSTHLQSRSSLIEIEDPCRLPTTQIIAEYDFTLTIDGSTILITPELQAQIKADFELQMSQYFTICDVIESSCPDYDKWIVPYDQFWDYLNSPIKGQGSGIGKIRPRGGQQENLTCVFP